MCETPWKFEAISDNTINGLFDLFEAYQPFIEKWRIDQSYDPYQATAVLCLAKNGPEYDEATWRECTRIIDFIVKYCLPEIIFRTCQSPVWHSSAWRSSFLRCLTEDLKTIKAKTVLSFESEMVQQIDLRDPHDSTRANGSNHRYGRGSCPGYSLSEAV